MKSSQFWICCGVFGAVLFLFQNCGQVGFNGNAPKDQESVAGEGGTETGNTSGVTALAQCEVLATNSAVSQGSLPICMSENACLVLVNSYAQTHGCTLASGAPTTPGATATCTQVIPGSQSSCGDATVLSDAEVNTLLANLGSSN